MREIYRGWIIEARPEGRGTARIWHAFVEESPITYTRYGGEQVTRSYGTATAGIGAAREYVDGEISAFAHLCRMEPQEAVKSSKRAVEAARARLARAQRELASAAEYNAGIVRQRVEDTEGELTRRLADLRAAEHALEKTKLAHQS